MVCLENIVYVVNILKSVLITLVSYSYTVDIITFHSIFISGKFTFDKNIQPIGDMHILPALVIFISKYKYWFQNEFLKITIWHFFCNKHLSIRLRPLNPTVHDWLFKNVWNISGLIYINEPPLPKNITTLYILTCIKLYLILLNHENKWCIPSKKWEISQWCIYLGGGL